MSRPRLNILRNLRVQMKTGFLREQPIEYNYLRRFPPLSRDTLPASLKTKEVFIPYANLYRKVVAKNPMYLDEKVYPAFGYQEPQALVVAKRQYQYIQEGMTEEEAYRKALEYVGEVEDQSFQQLKSVQDALNAQGATAPFLSDPNVATTVETWQNKLKETSYEELTLAEQGELDYFVQTNILKWNEVERERRMKDPIFVLRFKKLIDSLFPKTQEQQAKALATFQSAFKENFFQLYNYDASKLQTMQSFFVEDYVKFINKALQQPDLQKWSSSDREEFSKWIIDTLAYRDGIENRSSMKIQKYLDSIRDQFFPMLRFPQRVSQLKSYNVDEIKAILYANDVGYKRQDGKLFVQRFYRLPMLLFPRDVLCTNITLNQKYLTRMLEGKDVLTQELKTHGISDVHVEDVQKQLADYQEEVLKTQQAFASNDEIDMSILDDILGEEKSQKISKEQATAASTLSGGVENKSSVNTTEWEKLVKGTVGIPKTDLEKERHSFYSQVEFQSFETISNEDDLEHFKQVRLENELIVRARLARDYETKEAARRVAEWEKRGLWTSELPPPSVPLVD